MKKPGKFHFVQFFSVEFPLPTSNMDVAFLLLIFGAVVKDYLALLGMTGLLAGTTLFVGGSALFSGQADDPEMAANSVTNQTSFEVSTEPSAVEPPAPAIQDRKDNKRSSARKKSTGSKSTGSKSSKSTKPNAKKQNTQKSVMETSDKAKSVKSSMKDSKKESKKESKKDSKKDSKNKNQKSDDAKQKKSKVDTDPGNLEEVELDGSKLFAGSLDTAPMTTDEMFDAPLDRLARVIDSSAGPTPTELHGTWDVMPCHADKSVAGTRHFDSLNLKVASGAYFETVQYYADEEQKVLGPQTTTTYYVKVDEDHMLAVVNRGTPNAMYSVLKKTSSEIPEKKKDEETDLSLIHI